MTLCGSRKGIHRNDVHSVVPDLFVGVELRVECGDHRALQRASEMSKATKRNNIRKTYVPWVEGVTWAMRACAKRLRKQFEQCDNGNGGAMRRHAVLSAYVRGVYNAEEASAMLGVSRGVDSSGEHLERVMELWGRLDSNPQTAPPSTSELYERIGESFDLRPLSNEDMDRLAAFMTREGFSETQPNPQSPIASDVPPPISGPHEDDRREEGSSNHP